MVGWCRLGIARYPTPLGQCDIREVLGKTAARKVTFGPLPVYFWSGAWSLEAEPAATWVESMDDGSYIISQR